MNLPAATLLYSLILGGYAALLWFLTRRQPRERGLIAWFRRVGPINRKESVMVFAILIACAGWGLEFAKQSDSLSMSGFVTEHDPAQTWSAKLRAAGFVGEFGNVDVQRITEPRFQWARWRFSVTGERPNLKHILEEYVSQMESDLRWKLNRTRLSSVSSYDANFAVEFAGLLTRGTVFGSVSTLPDGSHRVIVEACEYPY